MATATERYKILQNIIAQKGMDADLWTELAKVESMINGIDQQGMMPPPVPSELTNPQGELGAEPPPEPIETPMV